MRRLLVALLLSGSLQVAAVHPAHAGTPRVVLDPGHGGIDPGAVADDGVYEKTVNLALARRVRDFLEVAGVEVILTREADDYCPSLAERAALANNEAADLFVSLHANSDRHPSCKGIELFYYPGSREGSTIAGAVKRVIDNRSVLAQCRVKTSCYLVLKKTAMPALLVEAGYLSNAGERRRLLNPAYREELARAVAEGIITYLAWQHLPVRPRYTTFCRANTKQRNGRLQKEG